MYDFHYKFIKKHFNAKLLFTDIDSLTYEIKSEDFYEEYFRHKHLFDFSNYPKDSKFFDPTNRKDIGKMKDESEEKIIGEFVGLKWKMYSMLSDDGKESNTAKGVNIATEFNECKTMLFNKKKKKKKCSDKKWEEFKAKKYKLATYEINKKLLSVLDYKRFALDGGIHILAYFHKDLKR